MLGKTHRRSSSPRPGTSYFLSGTITFVRDLHLALQQERLFLLRRRERLLPLRLLRRELGLAGDLTRSRLRRRHPYPHTCALCAIPSLFCGQCRPRSVGSHRPSGAPPSPSSTGVFPASTGVFPAPAHRRYVRFLSERCSKILGTFPLIRDWRAS